VATVLLIAATAQAQTKTGTTIGAFLLIEPGARAAGMGNAGVSLDDGIESVWFNPAAISRVEGASVQIAHAQWFADISFDHVAAALPLGKWGNAYAAVTSLGSGDIAVRTVTHPEGTGELFHVSDIAIGLGYGRQITDRFSAGGQITYVQETIWNTSLSTATLSFGTLYRVSENGIHLGASLANFGTQARFSGSDLRVTFDQDPDRFGDNSQLPAEIFTDEFSVPVLFRVGAGMPVRFSPATVLQLAVDAEHPNDNTESLSAGAELAYKKLAALRMGWQKAFQQDAEVGFTAGGGVRGTLESFAYRLDYAWAAHGRLGSTHRFALVMNF
jgi:hypothetical protein